MIRAPARWQGSILSFAGYLLARHHLGTRFCLSAVELAIVGLMGIVRFRLNMIVMMMGFPQGKNHHDTDNSGDDDGDDDDDDDDYD